MEALNCRRDGPNCFIRFWVSAKTREEGGPLGWFYTHVLRTRVQLVQKARRNISYRIKALWSSRKNQGLQKGGGIDRKSGVSIEAPQMLWFGKALNCAETGPHSHPPHCLQDPGLECLVQRESILRGNQGITEHKGPAMRLSEKHPVFPGLPVGKTSDSDPQKASSSPWEPEKRESSSDLFQAGNQKEGEGRIAKECETPVPALAMASTATHAPSWF